MDLKGMDRIDVVFNRVRPCHMQKNAGGGIAHATEMLNRNVIGVVPEDVTVAATNAKGTAPELCKNPSGAAFDRIARRLCGETVALQYPKMSFFGRVQALFTDK